MKILLYILFIFPIFFLQAEERKMPQAVKGVLDLNSEPWDFEKDGILKLNGEWEFYWGEFLPPNSLPVKNEELKMKNGESVNSKFVTPNSSFIPFPSQWQKHGYPSDGYATYRLTILMPVGTGLKPVPTTDTPLALHLTEANSNYSIYINGELFASNGKLGKSKSESKPFLKHKYLTLPEHLTKAEQLEIVIHVSNFHEPAAGFLDQIRLGTDSDIKESAKYKQNLDLIVIGFLLMMGLYHLGLYTIRRKDSSPLYLGLFCLLIVLRVASIGERIILDAFPGLPFFIVRKIEFLSFYFGTYLFFRFTHALFPEGFFRSIYYGLSFVLLSASFLVLFFPEKVFIGVRTIIQITALVLIIQILYSTILGIRFSKMGARLFLIGFIVFAGSVISDILKAQGILQVPSVASYGLLAFTFFQAIVLSRRFADGMERAEKLGDDLEKKSLRLEETAQELKQLTENLEIKVEERTVELELANKEIEKLNKITKKINSVSDLSDILTFIMLHLEKDYKFNEFWMLLKDDEKNELVTFAFVSPVIDSEDISKMKNIRISLDESSLILDAYNQKKVNQIILASNHLSSFDKSLQEIHKFNYYLGLPFVVYDETIGILFIHNSSIPETSHSQIKKLQNFTNQIAGAIYNSKLFKQAQIAREDAEKEKAVAIQAQLETEKQKRETEELNKLIKSLNENQKLENIMEKVINYLEQNFGIQNFALYVVDKIQNDIYLIEAKFPDFLSKDDEDKIRDFRFSLDSKKGSHAAVVRSKKTIFAPNMKKGFLIEEEQFAIDKCQYLSFFMLPLVLNNETIGVLDLSTHSQKLSLSRADITKISILGEQLAGIIYGSSLFKQVQIEKEKAILAQAETEREKQETEELNNLIKSLNEELELKVIMNKVIEFLNKNFGIEKYALYGVDSEQKNLEMLDSRTPDHLALDDLYQIYNMKIPINTEIGGHSFVLKTKKPLYLKKINLKRLNENASDEEKYIIGLLNFVSLFYIPLYLNNEPVGILDLYNIERRIELTKGDVLRLSILGEQLAGIIHGSKLFQEVQAEKERAIQAQKETEIKRQEIEYLNNFTKLINSLDNLDAIFKEATNQLREKFGFDVFWLQLIEKNKLYTRCLEFPSSRESLFEKYYNYEIEMSPEIGSTFLTFNKAKLLYIPNLSDKMKESFSEFDQNLVKEFQFNSVIQSPLIVTGEVIGILHINKLDGFKRLHRDDLRFIQSFCEQLALAVNNSKLYEASEVERQKSEKLLLNILPSDVARELKEKGAAEPELFEEVSVMFTDFKGFTQIAERMEPAELVKELDACFVQFDKVTERLGLEKLKTIGDSYMCAGGIPKRNKTHAVDSVLAAMEIQNFMLMMKDLKEQIGFPYWELRLGIHTGPLVAGVIGEKKFAYDVWGDTVNTASRMESSGEPGRINISGTTYARVKEFFECEYRGKVNAKNKGEVDMYYVLRLKKEFSKDEDGKVPNGEFWDRYGENR
jgi:class 3 adenylate cyclase/nitrate/nitrite-specific signal transduction histidine kinase